jgi:hypothetical protein
MKNLTREARSPFELPLGISKRCAPCVHLLESESNIRHVGVLDPATTGLYTQAVPDGHNGGVIFLMGGDLEVGTQQTLIDTLLRNTQYRLTVDIANITTTSPFNFSDLPGYRVDLLSGDAIPASDNNSVLPGEGLFEETSFSYSIGNTHTNLGEAPGIRLVNLNDRGIEVNFDHIRLDATADSLWSLHMTDNELRSVRGHGCRHIDDIIEFARANSKSVCCRPPHD